MIGECAIHVPIAKIPAHVIVIRRSPSRTLRTGRPYLQQGDQVRVVRPGTFSFSYEGNRYRLHHAVVSLSCRRLLLDSGVSPSRRTVLAVSLQTGLVDVRAGNHARRALVLTPEMMALATTRGSNFKVERNPVTRRTRAWTLDNPIVTARASDQRLRIATRVTYTAISDFKGLRLDVWPFSISRWQRAPRRADRLSPFWEDGQQCSTGCTPPGAIPGWPIRPFHTQHAIRAGLNELRPANFHVAVDIDANDFQPVYAIQSGYVRIRYRRAPDENVDVGQFDYWHLNPTVVNGQYAVAYKTELGTVKYNFKHVAFSEIGPGGQYLNPLRPGGSLRPYTDADVPIIAVPHLFADGRVTVGAFDPQSFADQGATYETPVLAPAALAWRLFDSRGREITGLHWALRGSQNYPPAVKPLIFAPGAANPGYNCFAFRRVCVPKWVYWLAGGLTEPLPLASLRRGRYRMTVYAWDWAGNSSALDNWITVPLAHPTSPPNGQVIARFDFP